MARKTTPPARPKNGRSPSRAAPRARATAKTDSARTEAAEPGARAARRRERSRGEILDAARAVVLERGLKATTLADVARAVGLTKAALYYYFPSKEALLEELNIRQLATQSQRLHDAVAKTAGGPEALRALIRETVEMYAPRLDDFRLNYLHPQLAADSVHIGPAQLERIRPFNDLAYAGAAQRVASSPRGRADVEPRLLVFLANLAAVGVLTMKGLVEAFDDPLRYSDEEMIEALARIFEAAARP